MIEVTVPLAVFCFSVLWAGGTIYSYAEPHLYTDPTDRWLLGLVFFAYVIAWLPVVLLPIDIARIAPPARCQDQSVFSPISMWWRLIYVANLATGYVVNDFARLVKLTEPGALHRQDLR